MQNLIDALNSPDETERIYAVQDMAEAGNPDFALPLIEKLSTESSQGVRDAIVFALSRESLACSNIFDKLFDMLYLPDAYLRNAAINIFGVQGKSAIEFLSHRLNSKNAEVRKLILDALFATGDQDAISYIRSALKDASINVQITAVEYLGRFEDKHCADDLISLLRQNDEPMLRAAISESLAMIGSQKHIREVFSILAPNNNFSMAESFYFPQMLRLSAKIGDISLLENITDAITDILMYAEDILSSVEEISQYADIIRHQKILKIIQKLMKESSDEKIQVFCKEIMNPA